MLILCEAELMLMLCDVKLMLSLMLILCEAELMLMLCEVERAAVQTKCSGQSAWASQ